MEVAEIIKKFLADSSWLNKAKEFIADKEKMRRLLEEFRTFFDNESLKEVKGNMLELLNYVKDVIAGNYDDYDLSTLVLVVASIIYVVSPIDIIPDIIPVLGLTDDLAVIGYVFKSVNEELCKYRKTKNGRI